MGKLILDTDLKAKLNGLDRQMEICDETGKTLGRFVPEDSFQKLVTALVEVQRPYLSPEEVERRRNEPGGRTLSEIPLIMT